MEDKSQFNKSNEMEIGEVNNQNGRNINTTLLNN